MLVCVIEFAKGKAGEGFKALWRVVFIIIRTCASDARALSAIVRSRWRGTGTILPHMMYSRRASEREKGGDSTLHFCGEVREKGEGRCNSQSASQLVTSLLYSVPTYIGGT